ncbi:MAG: hypothetical protein ABGX16_10210 [Pirellulales bacterium]
MVSRSGKIEPEQQETIVREVVRQLRAMTQTATVSTKKKHDPQDAPRTSLGPTQQRATQSVVKLGVRVVTLAEVEGRLEGVKEVVIGPQAILTPAVRDVLTQQQIAVTRTTLETASASQLQLLVGGLLVNEKSLANGKNLENYWQQIQRLGISSRRVVGANLATLVQEMGSLLASGTRLGMLLTVETAVAHCLANRQAGVRAILANKEDAVRRDTQAVGANLLVVSPHGLSTFQVGNLVSKFYQQGIQPCPEEYRRWLDDGVSFV